MATGRQEKLEANRRRVEEARRSDTNKPRPNASEAAREEQRNKTKVKTFRYPADTLTESSDYMQIQVVKYTPPGIGLQGADAVLAGQQSPGSFEFRPDNGDSANRKRAKEKTVAFIQLPMPAQLGDTKRTNWTDGKLPGLAAAAGSLVQQFMKNPSGKAVSDMESLQGALNVARNAAAGMAGQAGGLVGLGQDFLTNMAINMIPGANVSFDQFLARNRGVVINPNTEFLFNGPSLRNFGFMYTFVPRNHREAEDVKGIIRTFKQTMSPRSNIDAFGQGQNLFGGLLQSPDVYKIRYMSGNLEHPFLNKFKFCALTDMDVQYNGAGQGYVSYDDGTPVVVTMQLRFTELTPIYYEDYDGELGRGGVGY
jgi:hypothetical protein